jgi:hypothetical protein
MMAGLLVGFVLSACVAVRAEASPLLEMLALVPRDAVPENSGWAIARYANYEAVFAAEGVAALRELGDPELLLESLPLGSILSRIVAGPEAINYLFVSTGRMADVVGFEWLVDVDRSLEFGEPPDFGLLLGGGFDAEAIGAALQSRSFALAEVEGVPVWHRFEDREISLVDREPADPFGGHLGAAARIAVLPEMLGNARSWPLIEAMLASDRGEIPSLVDDPGYRALAETVAAPDGLLIQALLFTGPALRVPNVSLLSGVTWPEPLVELPWYSHAILADRQEGNDQVHLIGLVCADAVTAQTASVVLAQRLETFHPPDDPDRVFAERYGATISPSVIDRPEDGLAIACVEARYPLPAERIDPESGLYTTSGLLYRAWVSAILRREFTPLW